jgi:site-specific DNA-methyltransferase (adenine-specific)
MLTITNEDNMALMARYPDGYFDLAIVDPPYGIGLSMVTKHGSFDSIHENKQWNNHIPSADYFKELHRVSKNQIIWGCNYYAQYISVVGRIVHDKMLEIAGTKLKYSEADLASCSLQKRITMFRYRWNGNRQGNTINWKNEGENKRIHPTQKPIELYKWLLDNYAKKSDKILDTHLGSGSIAIACHDYGYDLTACELDKQYFDAAMLRIKQHTDQIKLF